ncbi:unnamed protein product, partial [Tetraodon nigroviridis]
VKQPPAEGAKSNPSKRHRDRLNGELERLAGLLPFPEEVTATLDKLSILRLSSDVVHQSVFELIHTDDRGTFRQQLHFALNPPAENDGEGPQGCGNALTYSPDQLPPENSSFLERNFVCRFRCLLDNCSGFLALSFQGRLKYLHGQRALRDNGTCSHPQLALFTIAVPVHPPPILEIRAKMLLFQTKHKLDFTPMGIDSRGKAILVLFGDGALYERLRLPVHPRSRYDVLRRQPPPQYVASWRPQLNSPLIHLWRANAHVSLVCLFPPVIKTGESGMTVFRLLSKSSGWVWVKANAKLIYKGGRPDFINVYQRALV